MIIPRRGFVSQAGVESQEQAGGYSYISKAYHQHAAARPGEDTGSLTNEDSLGV